MDTQGKPPARTFLDTTKEMRRKEELFVSICLPDISITLRYDFIRDFFFLKKS